MPFSPLNNQNNSDGRFQPCGLYKGRGGTIQVLRIRHVGK